MKAYFIQARFKADDTPATDEIPSHFLHALTSAKKFADDSLPIYLKVHVPENANPNEHDAFAKLGPRLWPAPA